MALEGPLDFGLRLASARMNVIWTSRSAARDIERAGSFQTTFDAVDYWRARGWPDLCRPMGADDFVCD